MEAKALLGANCSPGSIIAHQGKILKDEDELLSAGVTEAGYYVVMPTTAAAPPAAARPGAKLAVLRGDPQFQALRGLAQRHPGLVAPLIEELVGLAVDGPAIRQEITDNEAEFMEMINEPLPPDEPDLLELLAGISQDAPAGDGDGDAAPPARLTNEDKEAVQRLTDLGFSHSVCLAAYVTYGCDEATAADYLLANAGKMPGSRPASAAAP